MNKPETELEKVISSAKARTHLLKATIKTIRELNETCLALISDLEELVYDP